MLLSTNKLSEMEIRKIISFTIAPKKKKKKPQRKNFIRK
jgi:hypothetical protein